MIMSPYYLNLASLTFSAMSTTPHRLLISSFHNVSDQLSFISFYIHPFSLNPASFLHHHSTYFSSLIFFARSTIPHLRMIIRIQAFKIRIQAFKIRIQAFKIRIQAFEIRIQALKIRNHNLSSSILITIASPPLSSAILISSFHYVSNHLSFGLAFLTFSTRSTTLF